MSTLEQVATWGSGGTPKTGTPEYYGGSIPWAVIGDLNDGPLISTKNTITESGLANSSAKWVPAGAVLIAMYGSIGKLGITRIPITTNQAIAFATPNPKLVDIRYLFWYLRSQRDALTRAGRGGTQQNISQTILKSWPIPVPPLAEQCRIIEALEDHLSRLDAAEKLIDRSAIGVRRLERFISSITYRHEFSKNATSSTSIAPCETDDRTLPTAPPGWTWKRLEEIADVVGGVTKDKKRQSDPSLPEVPYLRVANVQRGWLDLSEIAVIRIPEKKALQLALKYGDVLLNEGGDRDKLGRGWVWENQVSGAVHQNHVFRARIHGNIIHPKLLSWYANSVAGWFEANGKQSVNLASISLSKIKELPVPIPPLEEQAEIVERIDGQLSRLDAAVNLSRQAKSKAKVLRQAILFRAFSGKLVPQDPTDEPVSVFLDRVHADHRVGGKPQDQRITRRRRKTAVVVDVPPPPFTTVALAPTNAVQQELSL